MIHSSPSRFEPFERPSYISLPTHPDLVRLTDRSVAQMENALLTVRVHSSKQGILPVL